MIGTRLLSTAFIAAVLSMAHTAAATPAASVGVQTAAQVTPADAAPFIGDWTLALQGPDRAGAFDLSIKVEKEKVVAEITAETMPKQAIPRISMDQKRLVLGYSFTYDGNPVDAVVSMTPGEDGKMAAQIDFAGGAYIMSGMAAKKDKPKQ